jgi:hypothetical protein
MALPLMAKIVWKPTERTWGCHKLSIITRYPDYRDQMEWKRAFWDWHLVSLIERCAPGRGSPSREIHSTTRCIQKYENIWTKHEKKIIIKNNYVRYLLWWHQRPYHTFITNHVGSIAEPFLTLEYAPERSSSPTLSIYIYSLFKATCYRWDGAFWCQSSHSNQWKKKSN